MRYNHGNFFTRLCAPLPRASSNLRRFHLVDRSEAMDFRIKSGNKTRAQPNGDRYSPSPQVETPV